MRRLVATVFATALFLLPAAAQQTQPAPALPYTPSLDPASMDRTVDPCVDFYEYSCGGWRKMNPIPPDQTRWSVYGKLYEDNLNYLRGILEAAATAKDRDAVTQKIGDYYAACMNEAEIEKLGAKPLDPAMQAIANLHDKKDLAALIATLQVEGTDALFRAGSRQDPDDSNSVIMSIAQGGIALPDRDYYLKDDAKSKETREHYLQHVTKMFELLGDSPDAAAQNAATVMRIETRSRKPRSLASSAAIPTSKNTKCRCPTSTKSRRISTGRPSSPLSPHPPSPRSTSAGPISSPTSARTSSPRRSTTGKPISASTSSTRTPPNFPPPSSTKTSPSIASTCAAQKKFSRDGSVACATSTPTSAKRLARRTFAATFSPERKPPPRNDRRIEDAMALRIQQLDWMSPETKQTSAGQTPCHVATRSVIPISGATTARVNIIPDDFFGNDQRATRIRDRIANSTKSASPSIVASGA